jgi:hypothetical protein
MDDELTLAYAENDRLLEQRTALLEALQGMLGCCFDMERNDETMAAVKKAMRVIYEVTGEHYG